MPITIATWNVNSVKSRLPHLLDWLKRETPDVVLLQEIKCVNEEFPYLEIEQLGYHTAVSGQPSYNGVAILSRLPIRDVRKGLPGDDADTQARYIEAVIEGKRQEAAGESAEEIHTPTSSRLLPKSSNFRVASVYVPNGQAVDSDKFPYKLRFLDRLDAHMRALLLQEEPCVIGGDYNVAPWPEDVYDPIRLDGTVDYHPQERLRFRRIIYTGYSDAFRLSHPESASAYSFWDYRGNSFAANQGYRIDHLLLSPQAADRLEMCEIRKELRALEKASDHAPVIARLAL